MFTLNCKGRLLVVDKPIVMGIINTTPDSFYADSRLLTPGSIIERANQMINDGATILDIGGQSTRPGSIRLTTDEEISRVITPIISIKDNFPDIFISIDTYNAAVAKEAVAAGADIVNDISAGSLDKEMINTVATLNVPYVLMHMQGAPENMQQSPSYADVAKEILDFFIFKIRELETAGINDIIIDPGFGFGKAIAHNFELLKKLEVFQLLRKPVLLGVSRKSTISKTLHISAEDALNGTTILNTIGITKGATILRVHDVKEAMQVIKLVEEVSHK